MNAETLKDTVIIYHGGNCRDGFGAAYAAWKVFGDNASYIPISTRGALPSGLQDKEIYILDYSFTKDILEDLRNRNKSVLVIDHHETAKEDVTAFPDNIFSIDNSGAVLAWQYFHPDEPVPPLLQYVEDHDLWNFSLPHNREFGAALGEYAMDFETWDQLNANMADRDMFNSFIRHGAIIAGFEDKLVQKILNFKEQVEFEGVVAYAVNAERVYRSILGHELATLSEAEGNAPLGIVYYKYNGAVHCSLRSNGDFDAGSLAAKYGGGGHKNAASIQVDNFSQLPFRFI